MEEIIEWTVPKGYLEKHANAIRSAIIEQLMDDESCFVELIEDDVETFCAYITKELMHTFEHKSVDEHWAWPTEQYNGSSVHLEVCGYRMDMKFTCEHPLGVDQIYTPQYDGIVYNIDNHDTMRVFIQEYDDYVFGCIHYVDDKIDAAARFVHNVIRRDH